MINRKKSVLWIDLDNSPHVLFFYPIIRELKRQGVEIIVTARDFAQVYNLVDLFKLDCIRVGRHYGKNLIFKIGGTVFRALQLLPIIRKTKPTLALSHGSRSQLLLAKFLGIRSILAMDFEGAKGFPLLDPTIFLLPEVLFNKLEMQRKNRNLMKYPGIKEDVYVPEFKPDGSIISDFSLKDDHIIVTIRPPATLAHYHNPKSEKIFEDIINKLLSVDDTKIFILPRTLEQGVEIKNKWANAFELNKLVIPGKVVNGLNLIWHSDMVISGGGTMIREAAALNIPAYSFFQGEIGAVDQFLVTGNRLVLISDSKDIDTKILITKRKKLSKNEETSSPSLNRIVNLIEENLALY